MDNMARLGMVLALRRGGSLSVCGYVGTGSRGNTDADRLGTADILSGLSIRGAPICVAPSTVAYSPSFQPCGFRPCNYGLKL